MIQEDKELLLKDLCARLPYGVRISKSIDDFVSEPKLIKSLYPDGTILVEDEFPDVDAWDICEIKPYLRPLSSMTEEEKKEIEKITNNGFYVNSTYNFIANFKSQTYGDWNGNWHDSYNWPVTNVECNKLISWLDKKHFDHRTDEERKTLIEKGLALEAPEGMYNF